MVATVFVDDCTAPDAPTPTSDGSNARLAAGAGGTTSGAGGLVVLQAGSAVGGGAGGSCLVSGGDGIGNAQDGGYVNLVGGFGGDATTDGANGGNGGDIILTPRGGGNGMGVGLNGKDGNVFLHLPTIDPHRAGALWSNSGIVTVSAG
jgi:hypothetical protein